MVDVHIVGKKTISRLNAIIAEGFFVETIVCLSTMTARG
jgi:hypothetical protein